MTSQSVTQHSPTAYNGCQATILGLGTFGGGVAAARFLAERGAQVSITDLRDEATLRQSLAELDDLKIANLWLSGHPDQAFEDCDLLVVNPAVPPDHAAVQSCRSRGIPVTSEIELFLQHNPATVVAVTGSNGKSTTSALIRHLAAPEFHAMQKQVWLGGNIGVSLLHNLEQITADDVVVLELSSFQLHQLRNARFAPQIAVVTNFTANHLEWHGTLDSYRTAKNVILRQQHKDHVAILHSDLCHDPNWRVRGRLMSFAAADSGEDGVFAEEGLLIFRSGSSEDALRFTQPPQLPGKHNLANIAAAACAVWQLGLSPHRFLRHLQHFQPLPHRLQQVAHGRGVRFFNDSIATTPESAIAALNVCQSDCVILAGGYDKGIDLSEFARHIATHASAVVLMGQTSDSLAEKIAEFRSSQHTPDIRIASDFSNAFSQAVELVRPGGIVLLSPGCASYGWFRDFRDRGDQFTQLARQWVTDS